LIFSCNFISKYLISIVWHLMCDVWLLYKILILYSGYVCL
jgi:hypothetical protein